MTQAADNQSGVDRGWTIQRLKTFIHHSGAVPEPSGPNEVNFGYETAAPEDMVVQEWAVIEQILSRYLPDWRARVQPADDYSQPGYRWRERREAAILCLSTIESEPEVQQHLGDQGPMMPAIGLHPWIWDAARVSWEAGLYEDAVDAAARNVNSRLRAKIDRRDLSESDLISQAFSEHAGDRDHPRLRLPSAEDLSLKTARSIYGGMISFGKGLFQAVRNPLAHEAPGAIDMSEQEALESLAAFSLLARWIDRSAVHRS